MKHEKKPDSAPIENLSRKKEAMDALVDADKENVPQYSAEELKKYRGKSKLHIPNLLKVLAIKAWFYGAVCFFILWGLGTYISDMLDMLFVVSVALGMVTDLLLNHSLRFIEKVPGENDAWMMIRPKGARSLFLNILYATVLMFCVFVFYNLINYAIAAARGTQESVAVGVEPLLFGLLCMGFDMLFIGIKRLLGSIIRDAKEAAASEK